MSEGRGKETLSSPAEGCGWSFRGVHWDLSEERKEEPVSERFARKRRKEGREQEGFLACTREPERKRKMVAKGGEPCPVFRPSVEEFRRPFCEYVRKVMASNPGIAMFKVVPPAGWKPRAQEFPPLETIAITTPIRQHVFGKSGAYRCLLVEQKKLNAAEFEQVCLREGSHEPPKVGRRDDELCERAFWSAVTIRPPMYGADTPQSFFDDKVPFGWNLRNLGCLLKQYPVPNIPGVTFPMTYFGMWKSFFAWHVEDMDLFSINFLHFGAAKVWYCVSPEDRERFDQMAQNLFPDMHRECKAFLRHKDILLSPSFLKNYNIKYKQAKQNPGEFIVLNAGAYHSGFNLGFNCAEAVNFATEEWLPLGEKATRCTCSALKDAVRISMDMFKDPPNIVTTRSRAAARSGIFDIGNAEKPALEADAVGSNETKPGEKPKGSITRTVKPQANGKRRKRDQSDTGPLPVKKRSGKLTETFATANGRGGGSSAKSQGVNKRKPRHTVASNRRASRSGGR